MYFIYIKVSKRITNQPDNWHLSRNHSWCCPPSPLFIKSIAEYDFVTILLKTYKSVITISRTVLSILTRGISWTTEVGEYWTSPFCIDPISPLITRWNIPSRTVSKLNNNQSINQPTNKSINKLRVQLGRDHLTWRVGGGMIFF